MTSYNKCSGCGEELQNQNKDQKGYSPKENATLCMRCFKLVHYGEKSNNLEEFDEEKYLKEIGKSESSVILVIDALNPYQTLINNINKFIKKERLILVVNKTDVFPKSIPQSTIIEYIAKIAESKNIEFNSIVIASTTKNLNIDSLYDYMDSNGGTYSIIGYSNVGKSSLIRSIFRSKLMDVQNTISNTIGTTTAPIETTLNNFVIVDYPGFILKGNYQNLLNVEKMEMILPRKEIRVVSVQPLRRSMYSISDLAFVACEPTPNVQFLFSNELVINRVNYDKHIESDLVKHEFKIENDRSDIIISGLGMITAKKGASITILLPKGIVVNIVDSIYN